MTETDETPSQNAADPAPTRRWHRWLDRRALERPPLIVLGVVAGLALGGGVTAAALHARRPALLMLPPAPIAAMHDGGPIAIKGEVAETFGHAFIVQDGSGRALVDAGPKGDGGTLVAKAETVVVQGRFDGGVVHAETISHADGRNDVLGPGGPPPPPGKRGRDRRDDGPPGPGRS